MSCTHAVILLTENSRPDDSKNPMFLREIVFQPLLRWVSDALRAAGARSVCVVRKTRALDARLLACLKASFADVTLLEADSGAVREEVLSFVSGGAGDVLLVTAPALLTAHAIDALCAAHAEGQRLLTELLTDDETPTGVYCFHGADAGRLFAYLDGGFDLSSACRRMHAEGLPLGEFFVSDGPEGGAARVASLSELDMARRALQTVVLERLARRGVTVLDPTNTFVSAETVIGRDTTLLPGVMLRGENVIGEDCVIGPFTVISDSVLGDRCVVNASQIYDSKLGHDVNVGPYAYIRPRCTLGDRVKIGDFVELKSANIGGETKVAHLSYVGDADVGDRVNIGCGAITVNYDGQAKHRTVIEDGAFIGCNSNLVAPLTVGKGAYTAAGSTLTSDVPAGALGIARARQENKEEWAEGKLSRV